MTSNATCFVRCQHRAEPRWLTLALSLTGDDRAERLLSHVGWLICRVEAADALAASYLLENWESGIKSGAYFAFRKHHSAPQPLVLSEFQGHLHSDDMDVVAGAAALAVTRLLGGDALNLDLSEWDTIHEIRSVPSGEAADSSAGLKAAGENGTAGTEEMGNQLVAAFDRRPD